MSIRTTESMTERENLVCRHIEKAFRTTIIRTGYLDDFDFYGVRDGRTVGVGEIKCRNNPHNEYPTVYLSVHKWSRLLEVSRALNVRGIFVANWTDQTRWIYVDQINASAHTIAGRYDRKDAPNDLEPMILVPTDEMKVLPDVD